MRQPQQFRPKHMEKEFRNEEDAEAFARRVFRQGWNAYISQQAGGEIKYKVEAKEPDDVTLMRLMLHRSRDAPTKLAFEGWVEECVRRTMAEKRKENIEKDDQNQKLRELSQLADIKAQEHGDEAVQEIADDEVKTEAPL